MPYRKMYWTATIYLALTTLALSISIGMVAWWWVQNNFSPSSSQTNIQLDAQEYHLGDLLTATFYVVRYRSCTLNIGRYLEPLNPGPNVKKEFLIQQVTQGFPADVPPTPRFMSFTLKIPESLDPGDYFLFSRVRYFCNPLDLAFPRIINMSKVKIKVVP